MEIIVNGITEMVGSDTALIVTLLFGSYFGVFGFLAWVELATERLSDKRASK